MAEALAAEGGGAFDIVVNNPNPNLLTRTLTLKP